MGRSHPNRREVLATAAAFAGGLAAPALVRAAPSGALVVGVNAALSGPFAAEGAEEVRGARLAAAHLNGEGDGGMLAHFSPDVLGRGGLGRRVAVVARDSRARADAARAGARDMIARDRVSMITGGSSSGAAIATQSLCQEAGIVYMAGVSHANATTGRDRAAHGFRHFLNSQMSAAALGPALARLHGADRRAHHLVADTNWGWEQHRALVAATEARGWTTLAATPTPVRTTDFRRPLAEALRSDADVLVLVHYGGNMVASLRQAAELGAHGRLVDGRPLEIAVPVFIELTVAAAGAAVAGVTATQDWSPDRDDAASAAFVRSYLAAHGVVPGQAARTAYVQTLLYADAIARAGDARACGVIEALEGHAFDGLGDGPSLYRAADHQCFKSALVVRGRREEAPDRPVEIVESVTPGQLVYPQDHPLVGGAALAGCGHGG